MRYYEDRDYRGMLEVLKLAELTGNTEEKKLMLFGIWDYHLRKGNYSATLDILKDTLLFASKIGDAELKHEVFVRLTNTSYHIMESKEEVQKACELVKLLADVAKNPNDFNVYSVNSGLAKSCMNVGDFVNAIQCYGRLLEYLNPPKKSEDKIPILIDLATAFFRKGDIDNAIRISKNALDIVEKNAATIRKQNLKGDLIQKIAEYEKIKAKK